MQHKQYSGSELVKIFQGQLHSPNPEDVVVYDILIDSRKLISPGGALFFALASKRNDGHHYIGSLYKKGVRYFVVTRLTDETTKFPEASFFVVNSTLTALQRLTAEHRKHHPIPVIGITGSNGKTIVKEWLYQLLHDDKKIIRSPKSYNSQIGVPLSVWQMSSQHELGIFEAGISEPEEMQFLQPIIQPTVGVFTNLGPAHDENFINHAQKTGEKLKLFTRVDTLIYRSDHKEIHGAVIRSGILEKIKAFTWGKDEDCTLVVKAIRHQEKSTAVEARYKGEPLNITIPFTDEASIENAIHCWATMLHLGYQTEVINARMQLLTPVAMRLELKEGINNSTIINDAYNSDFNSLAIALDFLNQQNQHKQKTVILSDILQSGQNEVDLYSHVASLLKEKNIHQLIGIGKAISRQADKFERGSLFFDSTEDLIRNFSFASLSGRTILLKGARVFEFEELSRILQQKAHETVLEINLNALINNLNKFRAKVSPGTQIMAMVKAFSYGSGSFEIANVLQYHQVDYLAVAYADEGVELRKAGIELPILVMSPEEHAMDAMIRHQLEPEIFNFRTMRLLEKAIKRNVLPQNKPVKIHLKVNTGMHRLGFDTEDLEAVIAMIRKNPHLYLQSVFSHLAASDRPEFDLFTQEQISRMYAIKELITRHFSHKVLFHLANSSGISRFPASHMDMVRLGIGMYGVGDPAMQLDHAIRLKSVLVQIRQVKKGESVGYNRSWVAEKDSPVGIVSIGYADGLLRALGNQRSFLYINNQPVPIIGDICMDMCMVDLTGIEAKENDDVIVFNEEHTVSALAHQAKTIPYEILSRISRRVKRIYYHE
ncbi:MAG: bifunctional UDP-N-acetylmuramoyl-tripeptide:D-alanyl-D-alanine ligase/alanine racemase [Bacteroidetes bacterium]|nr:bifunctional UDP-N-acetylmuramoyl-tripeptide:D-alanyl-D-alanine ligase/alanine racemase [Bacteroidota bacterium]